MNKLFSKCVYTSDEEQVVVYKQEHRSGGHGPWSCALLTRFSGLNESQVVRRFQTYEECHLYFCSFGTAEADAALQAAKKELHEDISLRNTFAQVRRVCANPPKTDE
jgi:hypothetical protein